MLKYMRLWIKVEFRVLKLQIHFSKNTRFIISCNIFFSAYRFPLEFIFAF